MKIGDVAADIQPLILGLLRRGLEVWLIGSRANGPIRPSSDWDFIVFGNEVLLLELSKLTVKPHLDLLVVTDGESFRSPWPNPDGVHKEGDLGRWKWSRQSEHEASYEGTKWPDDWGSPRKAIRVES